MARTTVDRAFRAGWQWSSRHGDAEATPAQADDILRTIGLPTDLQHMDAFCEGASDQSRGDRWRLDQIPASTRD